MMNEPKRQSLGKPIKGRALVNFEARRRRQPSGQGGVEGCLVSRRQGRVEPLLRGGSPVARIRVHRHLPPTS